MTGTKNDTFLLKVARVMLDDERFLSVSAQKTIDAVEFHREARDSTGPWTGALVKHYADQGRGELGVAARVTRKNKVLGWLLSDSTGLVVVNGAGEVIDFYYGESGYAVEHYAPNVLTGLDAAALRSWLKDEHGEYSILGLVNRYGGEAVSVAFWRLEEESGEAPLWAIESMRHAIPSMAAAATYLARFGRGRRWHSYTLPNDYRAGSQRWTEGLEAFVRSAPNTEELLLALSKIKGIAKAFKEDVRFSLTRAGLNVEPPPLSRYVIAYAQASETDVWAFEGVKNVQGWEEAVAEYWRVSPAGAVITWVPPEAKQALPEMSTELLLHRLSRMKYNEHAARSIASIAKKRDDLFDACEAYTVSLDRHIKSTKSLIGNIEDRSWLLSSRHEAVGLLPSPAWSEIFEAKRRRWDRCVEALLTRGAGARTIYPWLAFYSPSEKDTHILRALRKAPRYTQQVGELHRSEKVLVAVEKMADVEGPNQRAAQVVLNRWDRSDEEIRAMW